jgi:hypothetical protein
MPLLPDGPWTQLPGVGESLHAGPAGLAWNAARVDRESSAVDSPPIVFISGIRGRSTLSSKDCVARSRCSASISGGMVALAAAALASERVAGVILEDPPFSTIG